MVAVPKVAGLPAGRWEIDPVHSSVAFSIRHMVAARARGRFNDFSGHFDVRDPIERSTVEVTIRAASIDTSNPQRDAHLRSSDFLDVERYPEIRYSGRSVELTGENQGVVHGELTVRGVTRPVDLAVELLDVAQLANGLWVAGLSARAVINRHDFGVSWNTALEGGGLMLGSEVRIEIEIEARYQGLAN
jgi:polyisoprenoid-binding protein YceI